MPPKPKARDSRIPDDATLTNLWVANGGGTADGSCEVGLLDTMMRAVPVVLTEKEIADYKTENCGDTITLAEFDACCEFFVEKIGAGVDFGPIFDSFVAYHKSEGGQLTKAQFIQTLSSIGDSVAAEEVERVFNEADADGSGLIDRGEFVAFMSNKYNK